MEYMKRQQTFLDDTKKKIKDRLNKNTVCEYAMPIFYTYENIS